VKALSPVDVIYVPSVLVTCPACAGGLFARIERYFVDTGEPVEAEIYVGCASCDEEISDPTLDKVRHWVHSNYCVET